MATMHNRARLHRQEFLDTAPVIYPAEAEADVGQYDDDGGLDASRGVLAGLAVVGLIVAGIVALVWR